MTRHRISLNHEVTRILTEVRNCLDLDEILNEHGIIINKDGSVFDTITKITHPDLNTWATTAIEEDYAEPFEHMYQNEHKDDWD